MGAILGRGTARDAEALQDRIEFHDVILPIKKKIICRERRK